MTRSSESIEHPAGAAIGRSENWAFAILPYVITFGFLMAIHATTVNADFWVRIASGRLVVQDHIIPRHDPFTFTARGHDWIDHEWLLGAAMYVGSELSYGLVVLVATFLALVPFALMQWYVGRQRGFSDAALVLLSTLAMAIAFRSLGVRPQLVNYAFFAGALILIDSGRRGGKQTWMLVPMMLVWANLQAGFLIGIAAIVAWFAVSLLERTHRAYAGMILVGALGAGLINAYGWRLYEYTINASLFDNTDRELVLEWQSPDFHSFLSWPMIAGVVLLGWYGARGADRFRQLVTFGTLGAGLISARFLPFFSLSLVLLLAPALPTLRLDGIAKRAVRYAAAAAGAFALFLVVATWSNDLPENNVPRQGLAYLESELPDSRVYADQSWASYLTWNNWPTFFDTRTHQVFPERLVAQYHDVERTKGDYQRVFREWNIEYVMMPPDSDLGEALDGLSWERIFEGEIEVIWKRPSEALSPSGR